MRDGARGVLVLLVGAMAACGVPESAADTERDQGHDVELFGEGAVSTSLPEFGVSFTPSGDTAFFNRTSADRSRIQLFFTVRTDAGWSEGNVFEPLQGVRAVDPFVTLDGSYLYFSSDLPGASGGDGDFNLWRLPLRVADAAPEPLPAPVNTDASEVFNSIASDGLMVFSSTRDGERYIYQVRGEGADFGEPIRLALGDGTSGSNPALHPSGRYLVFSRASTDGPPDLYMACRQGDEWGAPIRLPEPVNSPFTDFAPAFGSGYLYFTSERPGVVGARPEGERPPGDIYRVLFEDIEGLCG